MPKYREKFAEGIHTLSAVSNLIEWACVTVVECS
jgi:hypothetical protein